MTGQELIDLNNGLAKMGDIAASAVFSYIVAKNFRKTSKEVKDMQKVLEHSEEWKPVQAKIDEVYKAHCRKDPKGNPISSNGNLTLDYLDKEIAEAELNQQIQDFQGNQIYGSSPRPMHQ